MKNKDFQEQLSESLLASALLEDAMMFESELPSDEELQEYHTFDESFESSLKKKIKKLEHQEKIRHSFRYMRKAVAVFVFCFGLLSASLFTVEASRNYMIQAIWTMKNHFLQLDYNKSGVKDDAYEMMKPTYIPMGYVQTSHYDDGFLADDYENSKDEILTFQYMKVSRNSSSWYSTDGYDVKNVTIGEYEGKLFSSDDKDKGTTIVWNDGTTEYSILWTDTNEKELLKIANSFR